MEVIILTKACTLKHSAVEKINQKPWIVDFRLHKKLRSKWSHQLDTMLPEVGMKRAIVKSTISSNRGVNLPLKLTEEIENTENIADHLVKVWISLFIATLLEDTTAEEKLELLINLSDIHTPKVFYLATKKISRINWEAPLWWKTVRHLTSKRRQKLSIHIKWI